MRTLLIAVLATVTSLGASETKPAPRHEIEQVKAFARLYGVVRFFYPSDAAASLDWNHVAVHGVKRVRTARDAASLATALREIFGPLGPGIEIGAILPPSAPSSKSDSGLVAWRYLGAGLDQTSGAGPYKGKRTHRSAVGGIDGSVMLMQTVPAKNLRGKTIRLRGQVRAATGNASGISALWLRVDLPGGMGFLDNMSARPIREQEWREYTIEGTVAENATNVAFGVMASGAVTADFDQIELTVQDAGGGWMPVPITDAGFETTGAPAVGWVRAGTSRFAEISRPADNAPEGRQFLRFAPPASVSQAELFEEAAPTVGAHIDLDLGLGLKARVPLVLTDAQARGEDRDQGSLDALRAALGQVAGPSDKPDVDVRLADVVVAWNVFRHFYPYWTESGVDWDACLEPQLEIAYAADTRAAQRNALRSLVADARDGHGSVGDTLAREQLAQWPVQLGIVGNQIVITASSVPSDAPVGARLAAIDGVPAWQRFTEQMQLASGTPQWKQVRALREITAGPKGAFAAAVVDGGAGARTVTLRFEAAQPPAEKRPEPLAELEPGLWYVDLTRAKAAQISPMFDRLASARGVVFDVRGYPTDAGAQVLPHLLAAPESDRWMHISKIVGPFGQSAGWQDMGWNLQPASPRLAGTIVFLTDGHAISYAESVMGYVADRKLGTIVGSPTAGTNGNVASFIVPSGFSVSFTGMRVTGHDGRTPHHLAAIKPDIPVAMSVAGLRGGHDEVLERAVALIRASIR